MKMKTMALEKTGLESGGKGPGVLEKLLVTLALFGILSGAPLGGFAGRKAVMDSRPPIELIVKEIERIEVKPVDATGLGGFGPTFDGIVYKGGDVVKC